MAFVLATFLIATIAGCALNTEDACDELNAYAEEGAGVLINLANGIGAVRPRQDRLAELGAEIKELNIGDDELKNASQEWATALQLVGQTPLFGSSNTAQVLDLLIDAQLKSLTLDRLCR